MLRGPVLLGGHKGSFAQFRPCQEAAVETWAEVARLVQEASSAGYRWGVEDAATGSAQSKPMQRGEGQLLKGRAMYSGQPGGDTGQDQRAGDARFTSSGGHWWLVSWAVK